VELAGERVELDVARVERFRGVQLDARDVQPVQPASGVRDADDAIALGAQLLGGGAQLGAVRIQEEIAPQQRAVDVHAALRAHGGEHRLQLCQRDLGGELRLGGERHRGQHGHDRREHQWPGERRASAVVALGAEFREQVGHAADSMRGARSIGAAQRAVEATSAAASSLQSPPSAL
jgi:hypothetical protein